MFLDELEEYTIKNWIGFVKNNSDLHTHIASGTTTSGSVSGKYDLINYNIVESSIVLNSSGTLIRYMPYENNKQISAIIVSGTNSTPIVSYDYLPFSILTRSRKKIDESNFSTPRLFVLWGNSVSMPYGRQVNDGGILTGRRRCYLTILIDVDEDKGGYQLKNKLTSKVVACIENNKDILYQLGFENLEVNELPPNEDYDDEEPLKISRGVIMVAFTTYPVLRR